MTALLIVLVLVISGGIAALVPVYGASAVALCLVLAVPVVIMISRLEADKEFLLRVFILALLARMIVSALIFSFNLQDFFGGDAFTYDALGLGMLKVWRGEWTYHSLEWFASANGWGMLYMVGAVYWLIDRNMLAVQLVNAVIGAATVPVIYLCARHMFAHSRVARVSALFVAFYPSLILWSSQGLKDAAIVFLLALAMLATLKLGEQLNIKYFAVLLVALICVLNFRFYVFYMVIAAVVGSFAIGMQKATTTSVLRQFLIIIMMGLAVTYLGVLRTASSQLDNYANLEAIQHQRSGMVSTANTGFGKDVDVSTSAGALSAIPVGMIYLLFAPFPWQLASLRQSITLPEMIVWWASFPLLILGLWFAVKYKLRQVLPVIIFTTMLSISYSVFQGNIGTAYRQRSQLLVFYFIFVAVGYTIVREKREDKRRQNELSKQQAAFVGDSRSQLRRN